MLPVHLYHVTGFRSTRVLWLYWELNWAYRQAGKPDAIPPVVINEFSDIVDFRNNKPEWYLALNPNGKVPTFVDPNMSPSLVMFESCAIIFHLLDTYDVDGLLLSRDEPAKRALYQQLAFYSSGTLDNLTATSVPWQRAVMDASGGAPAAMKGVVDPVKEAAWHSHCAPYYEAILKKNGGPYLLGAKFSAADVVFGHNLKNFSTRDGWLSEEKHPVLYSYFHNCIIGRPLRDRAYTETKNWPSFPSDSGITLRPAAPVSEEPSDP
jgi:glutathione S-transferase